MRLFYAGIMRARSAVCSNASPYFAELPAAATVVQKGALHCAGSIQVHPALPPRGKARQAVTGGSAIKRSRRR